MNKPIQIIEDNFQVAWAKMIKHLEEENLFNVQIHVNGNTTINEKYQTLLTDFAKENNLIPPKQVAHTIFPYHFYKNNISRADLYKVYWRYFSYTRKLEHSGWGTYFERMIRFQGNKQEPFDQLGSIIDNLNNRKVVRGHCNVIVIPYSSDQNKTMGQPCLNYISVQVEKDINNQKIINLLAIYRNHDFYQRAYGNYLGLIKLLHYIANETNSKIGKLTCFSSHAFLEGKNKKQLISIANTIIGENAVQA